MKDELKQMKEVELKDHLIFQGKVVALHEYDVKLPNGNTAKREVVRHTKGATILAINDKNECLLEHQFRFAYQEVVLELPAGKCKEGEDPLVAAKRELEEETGYKAGKIVKLGEFYPSCGYTDENIYLFSLSALFLSSLALFKAASLLSSPPRSLASSEISSFSSSAFMPVTVLPETTSLLIRKCLSAMAAIWARWVMHMT